MTVQALAVRTYHIRGAEKSLCNDDRYLSRNFVADAVENLLPSVVQLHCKRGIYESTGSGFL